MKAGSSMFGFRVLSVSGLSEFRLRAVHLVHEPTGLEVLHLDSGDRDNLFAFCFTTPPLDDSGVSHIMEHCVLSGSRRFPLKEPFSVLIKGSMHTFLNAFTFPDRTVYPASSVNPKDFFNLMLVYGDSVFFPLLRKETFMQEAWRFEPGGDSDPGFRYAGVVYNEMKGSYSGSESIVAEWAYRSLFPDNPYRFDSGGDPRAIPLLDHEVFRSYHARYYNPSNCRIFLYGNIPLEEKIEFIQKSFLEGATSGRKADPLPLQPRWTEARRIRKTFPIARGNRTEKRSTVCISWLSLPVTDAVGLLSMEVLTDILIASSGSPLRKRLVDSGLGEDLSPVSGLETEILESVFSVGLRGTEPDLADRIQELTLEELFKTAREGIERALVESMINRVEFRNREIRGGGGPYALRLLRRALRGWTHGQNPVESLVFTPVMGEMKARFEREPGYFEGLIRGELLENRHRVTLVVTPDPDQEERESEETARNIRSRVHGTRGDGVARLRAGYEEFMAFQKGAESAEQISCIPSLGRADLPREVEKIPTEEETIRGNTPLFLHDVFTNEIVYIDLLFPIDAVDEALSPFLPLFARAVCGCGLPGISYAEVAIELFRLTGGFFALVDASATARSQDQIGQRIIFRVKCLRKNLRQALDLVGRLLLEADFADRARIRDMIVEMRNDQKAAIIPGGHQFAALRAASRLCHSAEREEKWKGVEQLFFLEEICARVDERLDEISQSLERIRANVIRGERAIMNATLDGKGFGELRGLLEELCSSISASPTGEADSGRVARAHGVEKEEMGRAESLVTSAAVGYVARAIRGFRYGERLGAAQAVLGHLLATGYLWENVRMRGGAYGVHSYPRSMDGVFIFSSYRDPNIVRTLDSFMGALQWAAGPEVNEKDVERAVIGTVGREERPMDPGEKGLVALQRILLGITDELRQSHRDGELSVGRDEIMDAAAGLLSEFGGGVSVVVSNRDAVRRAGLERPELARDIRELPQ